MKISLPINFTLTFYILSNFTLTFFPVFLITRSNLWLHSPNDILGFQGPEKKGMIYSVIFSVKLTQLFKISPIISFVPRVNATKYIKIYVYIYAFKLVNINARKKIISHCIIFLGCVHLYYRTQTCYSIIGHHG